MTWKEPETMPPFNHTLRALRKASGATHRQISEAIGLKGMSYQNAEHKPFKAMSRDRVERLAAFHGLSPAERARLLAEWDALPISTYAATQSPRWTTRKAVRSKAKHHDAMKAALIEVLAVHLERAADAAAGSDAPICTCGPADPFADADPRVCEICAALHVLGFRGRFSGADPVLAWLAALQEPPPGAACP